MNRRPHAAPRRPARAASLLPLLAAFAITAAAAEPDAAPGVTDLQAGLAALDTAAVPRPADPALENTWENLHLHLRLARHWLRAYRPTGRVLGEARTQLVQAEACLKALRAGVPGAPVPGTALEGYYADNDDSFQPFLRHVPSGVSTGGVRPLLVFLHGYAPDFDIVNWASPEPSLTNLAERAGCFVLEPFGRSNTDFQGIGEQDVLRAIDEMEQRYPVDADRIVLLGHSMGGMGAWTIAAHYPGRFAAVAVLAGRGDYYFWKQLRREDEPPYKRDLLDAEFASELAPNLAGLPILVAHGDADWLIAAAEGRHMAQLIGRINPRLWRLDLPGQDHWLVDTVIGREDASAWLLAQRREAPAAFRYRTFHPRYDRCHWLTDLRFTGAWPAEIEAHASPSGVVVRATNLVSATLRRSLMPAALRALPVRTDGPLELREADSPPPASRPPPCGPVKEAFLAPFVFVRAGVPPREESLQRTQLAAIDWYRFAKAMPRLGEETRMSPADLRGKNVFLFGEPESSPWIREALAGSPVTATGAVFRVGPREFPREGNGLFVVRPSPWDPARLALVQCGLRWGEGLSENHKYDVLPDYIVYSAARDADGANTALCAGFFGLDGRLDPARQSLPAAAP